MLKKIGMLLLCVGRFYFSPCAQSVSEGDDIISSDIRIGIYNTRITDKGNNAVQTGRAPDIEFILGYEQGMNDYITFGVQSRTNIFFLHDTSQMQLHTAFGTDICVTGAFHFVRSDHVDLYIGAALGFSYLRMSNTTPTYRTVIVAVGAAYNLDLGARFYLNDKFALNFIVGYSGYYYPNGGDAAFSGYTDHFSMVFGGSAYSIGVSYKF